MFAIRRPVQPGLSWATALFFAACGGETSSFSAEQLKDLTDTWIATKIEYSSDVTSERVNLIAEGGTGSLVLRDDNSFELETSAPAGPNVSLAGRWQFVDDLFQLLPSAGGMLTFDVTLNADVLWLSGADIAYDFDGDGLMDPAHWNLEFARSVD